MASRERAHHWRARPGQNPVNHRGLDVRRPWGATCDACCDHACYKNHSIWIGNCICFAYIATYESLLIYSLDADVLECCSHTLGYCIRTEAGVLQVGQCFNIRACHLHCLDDVFVSCCIGSPPLRVHVACLN